MISLGGWLFSEGKQEKSGGSGRGEVGERKLGDKGGKTVVRILIYERIRSKFFKWEILR